MTNATFTKTTVGGGNDFHIIKYLVMVETHNELLINLTGSVRTRKYFSFDFLSTDLDLTLWTRSVLWSVLKRSQAKHFPYGPRVRSI